MIMLESPPHPPKLHLLHQEVPKKNSDKMERATRINWAKPPHRAKLEQAISEWDNKMGDALDINGNPVTSPHIFAAMVEIPYGTLYHYIHPDKSRHARIGNGVGAKTILDETEIHLVGDVLARADHVNKGKSHWEAVDCVQELRPDLSRTQSRQQLTRNILPKNVERGVLKIWSKHRQRQQIGQQ